MDAFWPVLLAVVIGLMVGVLVFVVARLGTATEGMGMLRARLGEGGIRGLQVTTTAIATIMAILLFSRATGLRADRVAFTGAGGLLICATLLKPAWFWEHTKVRWLRKFLGDSRATLSGLMVGAVLVLMGLFIGFAFGR